MVSANKDKSKITMHCTSSSDNSADELFCTKMSENHIRVAVVGNVDAGKSSLIGTLTTGQLDNGNGSSRRLITVHKHE